MKRRRDGSINKMIRASVSRSRSKKRNQDMPQLNTRQTAQMAAYMAQALAAGYEEEVEDRDVEYVPVNRSRAGPTMMDIGDSVSLVRLATGPRGSHAASFVRPRGIVVADVGDSQSLVRQVRTPSGMSSANALSGLAYEQEQSYYYPDEPHRNQSDFSAVLNRTPQSFRADNSIARDYNPQEHSVVPTVRGQYPRGNYSASNASDTIPFARSRDTTMVLGDLLDVSAISRSRNVQDRTLLRESGVLSTSGQSGDNRPDYRSGFIEPSLQGERTLGAMAYANPRDSLLDSMDRTVNGRGFASRNSGNDTLTWSRRVQPANVTGYADVSLAGGVSYASSDGLVDALNSVTEDSFLEALAVPGAHPAPFISSGRCNVGLDGVLRGRNSVIGAVALEYGLAVYAPVVGSLLGSAGFYAVAGAVPPTISIGQTFSGQWTVGGNAAGAYGFTSSTPPSEFANVLAWSSNMSLTFEAPGATVSGTLYYKFITVSSGIASPPDYTAVVTTGVKVPIVPGGQYSWRVPVQRPESLYSSATQWNQELALVVAWHSPTTPISGVGIGTYTPVFSFSANYYAQPIDSASWLSGSMRSKVVIPSRMEPSYRLALTDPCGNYTRRPSGDLTLADDDMNWNKHPVIPSANSLGWESAISRLLHVSSQRASKAPRSVSESEDSQAGDI